MTNFWSLPNQVKVSPLPYSSSDKVLQEWFRLVLRKMSADVEDIRRERDTLNSSESSTSIRYLTQWFSTLSVPVFRFFITSEH